MKPQQSIHRSDNIFIVQLEEARLEDVVQEKLQDYLKKTLAPSLLLELFFQPVEQALIETILDKQKKNQIQTAQILGINRNTLRHKIRAYRIDMKTYKQNEFFSLSKEVFLSRMEDLDILEISRRKLEYLKSSQNLSKNARNILASVEKSILQTVLRYFNYNQMKSATCLGINRSTLKARLFAYNLSKKPRLQQGASL